MIQDPSKSKNLISTQQISRNYLHVFFQIPLNVALYQGKKRLQLEEDVCLLGEGASEELILLGGFFPLHKHVFLFLKINIETTLQVFFKLSGI